MLWDSECSLYKTNLSLQPGFNMYPHSSHLSHSAVTSQNCILLLVLKENLELCIWRIPMTWKNKWGMVKRLSAFLSVSYLYVYSVNPFYLLKITRKCRGENIKQVLYQKSYLYNSPINWKITTIKCPIIIHSGITDLKFSKQNWNRTPSHYWQK